MCTRDETIPTSRELALDVPRKGPFDISDVIAIASQHPFYSSQHKYPLSRQEVDEIVSRKPQSVNIISALTKLPITQKHDISEIVRILASDEDARNTFRDGAYISVTGGGSGTSAAIAFLTDTRENRAQRAECGHLMSRLGLLDSKDYVLTVHHSGKLYRALDLTVDIIEYAGASALPAGHTASPEELLVYFRRFKPNVLAGETSQIINIASYIVSSGNQANVNINKILYTSEPITPFQRDYLNSVFRKNNSTLSFTSVFASAEMGVWAVSNFSLTGPQSEDSCDFIFDMRHMIVECLPVDVAITPENRNHPCTLEQEKAGLLVVTSLQRLRNPLVRYATGDIASIHPLPESARSQISGDVEHLRILRLYGRDIRHSFTWQGEYFEFAAVKTYIQDPAFGVLKWQVVLDDSISRPCSESLEIRLMRTEKRDSGGDLLSYEKLVERLKFLFCVQPENEVDFNVRVCALEEFIRSDTGNKVLMFVNRTKSKADS